MLLVSIGLSLFTVKMQQASRQREAVSSIRELLGWVGYDTGIRAPKWVRDLLGDDFLGNVSRAGLPTDAGVEHVKGLTQLQSLSLWGTKITDAGLVHLQGLTELQTLELEATQVTDAGVTEIQRTLPNCRIYRGHEM